MLHENIKNMRKKNGLSQEELAKRLHVVRQTISKWEQGLSVPDAEMLGCLAGELNTTTAALLGESVSGEAPDSVDGLAAALAELNDRYICQQEKRRKRQRIGYLLLGICAGIVLLSSAADLLYGWHANAGIAASADVIGGADAATHIYLSRVDLRWIAFIIALAGGIFAVIGLKKTHRA